MAPTALEKAENDRVSQKLLISFYQSEITRNPTKPLTPVEVEIYIEKINTLQIEHMEVQRRIMNSVPAGTDMTQYNSEFITMTQQLSALERDFRSLKIMPVPTGSRQTNTSTAVPEIRLPRIELPTFNGDLNEWMSFKDLFIATVHDNPKLTNAQRLTYLKSSVKGDAASMLMSMSATDTNYDIAWNALQDRFQNERELVFAILKRFMGQPSTKGESATSLRALVDLSKECIRSLEALLLPVGQWDVILVFIMLQKVDSTTRQFWELSLTNTSVPKLKEFMEFMEQRARALASGGLLNSSQCKTVQEGKSVHDGKARRAFVHHSADSSCSICTGSHPHFKCPKLIAMGPTERRDTVRRIGMCFNCLKPNHKVFKCTSERGCKTCSEKHHTLLHIQKQSTEQTSDVGRTSAQESSSAVPHIHLTVLKVQSGPPPLASGKNVSTEGEDSSEQTGRPSEVTMHSSVTSQQSTEVPSCDKRTSHPTYSPDEPSLGQGMLATALVQVMDRNNQPKLCRAFLDGGSTVSLITEACARRLGLQRKWTSVDVHGIGSSHAGSSKGTVSSAMRPHNQVSGVEEFPLTMLVMSNITTNLPIQSCNPASWTHLDGLQLADPHYYEQSTVDILIGSEIFWDLLLDGRRSGPIGSPIGICSKLGWLVAGNVSVTSPRVLTCHTDARLDEHLQRFWELESVPTSRVLTQEERDCEQHFVATTRRNQSGRYVVSFPFKKPGEAIGASREAAVRRLMSLEKRLANNPLWRTQYTQFMNEYLALGHMETIPPADLSCRVGPTREYYIPHHFVLKDSSSTTKFRVVFDASSKSSNGICLNEQLMVGPTLQDKLSDILMRFRVHYIAFTADIQKMYRQILVNKSDQDWQRIVWRPSPNDEIRDYRLLTVTYGTASAPYHATRVLKQLALDEKDDLPLASRIAQEDFYVDDLLSGASTMKEAREVRRQLIELCNRGGLNLTKWVTTHPGLLDGLRPDLREAIPPLNLDKDGVVKSLGLYWNPGLDTFMFKVNLPMINPGVLTTKRILLSEMSKVFDPLGWLSPITIRAKILFQQMWKIDTKWDDALPRNIQEAWTTYRGNLHHIESLSIPRCIIPVESTILTLHGFCDASEKAYAAVVYIRAETESSITSISIIGAKTRVAPAKQLSLPRLELCGALLLSKFMKVIQVTHKIPISQIHAWTDSTVVLGWLDGQSSRWKTFVANRVSEIQGQELAWGHVAGIDNPADCASRGLDPSELKNHPLWWTGPSWLKSGIKPDIPRIEHSDQEEIEKERRNVMVAATRLKTDTTLLNSNPNLGKLRRLTAWCLRFIFNCRFSVLRRNGNNGSFTLRHGQLTPDELDNALLVWVKIVQQNEFFDDIQNLKKGLNGSSCSRLRLLNPFLDSGQLLRVGGRLRRAPLSLDQRTPILLPRHHRLTQLIIEDEHMRTKHGGTQLILAGLQKRFWILGAKDAIRYQVKNCVTCTRHRGSVLQQFMGDLPTSRVTPGRPFLTCGVDYAGPFVVRAIPGRSKVTFKAYLALFICFTTHAVHLEVVSAMSTEAFLAALKRFIARRGKCRDIHSDCGTNFVGADREMKDFLAILSSTTHKEKVNHLLANEGIRWHFNPPGAPHFGGLWEAGVKSVKFHLHRVIGSSRLTFEELTTVMVQIEACLNSRPLTPNSTDPEDMTALTPGHFLIGDSLLAMPEPDLTSLKVNRLSRWQYTQQMTQHFWRRWSNEYLTRLQQRPKWHHHRTEVKIGDMVLVKEDNLPPLKWRLGRVTAIHPGKDGITRVATIKTTDGDVKRPIVKLCLLPIDNSDITT